MNKRNGLLGGTVALIVLLDQVTKHCVDTWMRLHESIPVVEGFLNITYVRNPGAAFGFLAGAPPFFRSIFFLSVTVLAVALVLYYIWKSSSAEPRMAFTLSLILAGAVGNLIDRIRFGEVIDFIDLYIGSYHWPAFNVADSAISVGAVLLVIGLFRQGFGTGRDAGTP